MSPARRASHQGDGKIIAYRRSRWWAKNPRQLGEANPEPGAVMGSDSPPTSQALNSFVLNSQETFRILKITNKNADSDNPYKSLTIMKFHV